MPSRSGHCWGEPVLDAFKRWFGSNGNGGAAISTALILGMAAFLGTPCATFLVCGTHGNVVFNIVVRTIPIIF